MFSLRRSFGQHRPDHVAWNGRDEPLHQSRLFIRGEGVVHERHEVRVFLGEVLREGRLGGVRGPRRALDGALQPFGVRGSPALVRRHELHRLVERLGDGVKEGIFSLVLELVRVGDVADPRGERGEDHLVLRGDVRAIRGEDESPPRHELVDQRLERL